MRSLILSAGLMLALSSGVVAEDDEPQALGFTVTNIDGQEVKLSDYQGKVVLVVNVASRCGLTPQYAGLQSLYEKYQDQGLVILGFPCNQFGSQEPGTEANIKEFCTENYGVTFPMFSKIDVNGEEASDLYKYLTSLDVEPKGTGAIGWNFEKFLIGRDGKVINRFQSRTAPSDEEFVRAIEAALKD